MADIKLPSWLGPFRARPRLVAAFLLGAAVTLGARYGAAMNWATSAIVGWDALCAAFILGTLRAMAGRSPADMRNRAAAEDERRAVILAVVLAAVAASIAAVAFELSTAKDAQGAEAAIRVTLAFATVAASWCMAHLIFALHYAHRYYDRNALSGLDSGGLVFPGRAEPDYWDFLHFAVIIGVASQTADIAISDQRVRRLNTVHAIFAFTYNTFVVALTINLLAGLFGD